MAFLSEDLVVAETGSYARISKLNSSDLFAGKWLRAPATKKHEGLAALRPASPFGLPDFTQESV
jgi:hypothetical protein